MIIRVVLFCGALLLGGPSLAAETFRDCSQCPEMVIVPPGSFKMGSADGGMNNNEGPQHTVTIRKAFAVGVYPVTFEQWGHCVAGGGCNSYIPEDQGWGRGSRPAIYINWQDAQAYVRWLNQWLLGAQELPEGSPPPGPGPYRLLTEAEWEYAARAGTTTAYYWGEVREKGRANCDGCGSEWDNEQTSPVGSFPPNPFGLHDMAGNVLQWVEDCYHETYTGAPTNGSAWLGRPCTERVMRGGSWFNSTYYIRSSQRFIVSPHIRANNGGFRVAKTLD